MIWEVIFKDIAVDFHKSAFQSSVISCGINLYICKCVYKCALIWCILKYIKPHKNCAVSGGGGCFFLSNRLGIVDWVW